MARREVDRGSKTESLRRQKGRVKTRIRDNQAWGSCVQFRAAIWNPTGLDEERGTTDSHMPEMVCLAGVSVVLLLSLLHPPPPPPPLWSASPFFMAHKWNICHMTGSISALHLGSQPWRHNTVRDHSNRLKVNSEMIPQTQKNGASIEPV